MKRQYIISALGLIAVALIYLRPYSHFYVVSHGFHLKDRVYTKSEVISEKKDSFEGGVDMLDSNLDFILSLPAILIVLIIIIASWPNKKIEDKMPH